MNPLTQVLFCPGGCLDGESQRIPFCSPILPKRVQLLSYLLCRVRLHTWSFTLKSVVVCPILHMGAFTVYCAVSFCVFCFIFHSLNIPVLGSPAVESPIAPPVIDVSSSPSATGSPYGVAPAERLRGGADPPSPLPTLLPVPTNPFDSQHDFSLDHVEEEGHTSSSIISPSILNAWYAFVACGTLFDVSTVRPSRPNRSDYHVMVVVRDVHTFLRECRFVTRSNIQHIAQYHGVRVTKRMSQVECVRAFDEHVCSSMCSTQFTLCRRLRSCRPSAPAVRHGELAFRVDRQPCPQLPAPMAEMQNEFFAPVPPRLDIPVFDYHEPYSAFPEIRSDEFKEDIMRAYQEHMELSNFEWRACAVCGQRKFTSQLQSVHPDDVDLSLLRNDTIPALAWPTSYDFELYEHALLEPVALNDPWSLQEMSMCQKCNSSLERGKQPVDSLANHQYYGWDSLPEDVATAFRESTMMERQLVAACRASTISWTYRADKGGVPNARQRYCRGNVAIIPQDVCALRRVLPPSLDDAKELMCVLFVGADAVPTHHTIAKMRPCLVSKRRVEVMIKFLIEHNPHYRRLGVTYSSDNLQAICSGPGFLPGHDIGVPATIDIQHLPADDGQASAVNSGYDGSTTAPFIIPPGEVFTETIGFANAAQGAITDSQMKARALKWCLDGHSFISVRAGDRLFPDRDPSMLTYVFPYLDPWGIGGFNNPARDSSQSLSMQHQTKNLLELYDSPFKRDSCFPYVCWNAIQKIDASISLQFRAEEKHLLQLVDEVTENKDVLREMNAKWESDQTQMPSTRQEKHMARLIDKLAVAAKDLKGSNGRKLTMRNHIRSLFKSCGCPALFMTLNPSDIHSPLMQALAGVNPEIFGNLSAFERAKVVADNPDAAAKFFDIVISAFRDYILRANRPGGGLFGDCIAHFGTVEAQGRGSLHCHMLIWLRGNPNPQALRDRLAIDPAFKLAMFGWLESIIKCEFPDMQPLLGDDPPHNWTRPDVPVDPRTLSSPMVPDGMSEVDLEVFRLNFKQFVTDTAIACNWHEHRDTCFKYLKKGEPRDDAHCRMRMNGQTRAFTELHPETQEILLRRLHPWINSYNDVVLFLQRCNMDIKYIGSGVAAKAFAFYVTDYITKPGLPLHLALQALSWAVKQNGVKFERRPDAAQLEIKRSLLTKIVNSMMGRQELSHQQVMSYLVGGGDCYKSHDFKVLYWVELNKHISDPLTSGSRVGDDDVSVSTAIHDDADISSSHEDTEVVELHEESHDVVDDLDQDEPENHVGDESDVRYTRPLLQLSRYGIAKTSLLQDYTLRSNVAHFDNLCVWDYVALVEKEPIPKSMKKKYRLRDPHQGDGDRAPQKMTLSTPVRFLDERHPLFDTHMCHLRTQSRMVPTLVGAPIPRRDRSPEEYERSCRALLILFKPWRTEWDLRDPTESWSSAYTRYNFPPHLQFVISNIHLENECKDARDLYAQERRAGRVRPFFENHTVMEDTEEWRESLHNDPRLDQTLIFGPVSEETISQSERMVQINRERFDAHLEFVENTLESCGAIDSLQTPVYGPANAPHDRDTEQYPEDLVDLHRVQMDALRKIRRPPTSKKRKRSDSSARSSDNDRPPATYLDHLDANEVYKHFPELKDMTFEGSSPASKIIEKVAQDMGIADNVEQSAALDLVGRHLLDHHSDQLMMYVAGEAGTGKSHVVRAIVELFVRCGVRARILLGAPTGIAAILIGGHTLHALSWLPKQKLDKADTIAIAEFWKDVDYLIVDEISMIGAKFLGEVSRRLTSARSSGTMSDAPFGGVSFISFGDFGQLKPVKQKSLYSSDLIHGLDRNQAQTEDGQEALHGISLWRQIRKVVKLTRNYRQAADPLYAGIVSRTRVGRATVTHARRTARAARNPTDYEVLLGRLLSVLTAKAFRSGGGMDSLARFRHCPIIVPDKRTRDALNIRVAQTRARQAGEQLHYYTAEDRMAGQTVLGQARLDLFRVNSTTTNDHLGVLPLFVGMKVMITENLDMSHKSVNGAEGVVKHIKYRMVEGHRVAVCAYVHVPGSSIELEGLPRDVVPVFPSRKYFAYTTPDGLQRHVSRLQLPLLPAYVYTDYKGQGRSLETVIADVAGSRSCQSLYVMLSRVKTLDGLAILRWFPPERISQSLTHELSDELARIDHLAEVTLQAYAS